jgi:hypothetical protein
MRGGILERLKRLEAALPQPEPKVRLLQRLTYEQGGQVLSTSISEGSGRGDVRTLFAWKAEDPDAAEKEAAFDAFLETGRFEILHLSVVYTRGAECRIGQLAQDGPGVAQDERTGRGEGDSLGGTAPEDVLRTGGERELRAEVARLTERLAELGEAIVLVERKGVDGEAN